MFTTFHLEIVGSNGKIYHGVTRIGGGTLTPEELHEHFKENHRFTKAQKITITPIEGDWLPADLLKHVATQPPMVDEIKVPEITLEKPQTFEQFKQRKFVDMNPSGASGVTNADTAQQSNVGQNATPERGGPQGNGS